MPEVFAGGIFARLWKKVYRYVEQSSWAIGAPMCQSRQSSEKQHKPYDIVFSYLVGDKSIILTYIHLGASLGVASTLQWLCGHYRGCAVVWSSS